MHANGADGTDPHECMGDDRRRGSGYRTAASWSGQECGANALFVVIAAVSGTTHCRAMLHVILVVALRSRGFRPIAAQVAHDPDRRRRREL
jgi:hypothetical protein